MAERHTFICSVCGKLLAVWDIGSIAKGYGPADISEEVIMVDECPHFKVKSCSYNDPVPVDAVETIWEDDKKWYFVPLSKGAKIKIEVKDNANSIGQK